MNESQKTVSSASEKTDKENPIYSSDYTVKDGCLSLLRENCNGVSIIPLCNFAPKIISEISYDDGAEVTRKYRIGGTHADGRQLTPVDVPATELEKMDWIAEKWDASCDLFVVPNADKHVRCAIKSTARYAKKERIYAHTGWEKIDGKWEFLLPGNGKFDVSLSGKNRCYEGTEEFSESDLADLRALLDSDFVSHQVLCPALALVFLSPLNEFLRAVGYEPKFVFLLLANTGSRKSTFAALMLSFFGRFSSTDLPMSFHDTANSIITTAFALKDVLTCVDDFHPTGRKDAENMKSIMQTLARGYGDRVGRNRLTSECELRESNPPRGNVIVTGEFPPDIGESGKARLFYVEMSEKCKDLTELSLFQDKAADGVFMRVMRAYIGYLSSHFLANDTSERAFLSILKNGFEKERSAWREKLLKENIGFHNRLPDTLSYLSCGFSFCILFLTDAGLLTEEEARRYETDFRSILLELSKSQPGASGNDKPTHVFIRKFSALIESGLAVLVSKTFPDPLPPHCLGYEDEEYFYLFFEVTHRAVKTLCRDQDEDFMISSIALGKALSEEGFLVSGGKSNTRSMKFGGRSRRVMIIKKDKVSEVISE